MLKTVTFYDFTEAFKYMRPDNFSKRGLAVLFDYIRELEEDLEITMQLDVIALCCEYAEDNIQDVLDNYNLKDVEELSDHTTVLEVLDDTVIYRPY